MKQVIIIVIAIVIVIVGVTIVVQQWGDLEAMCLQTGFNGAVVLLGAIVVLSSVSNSTRRVLLQAGACMGLMLNLWLVVSVVWTTYHAFSGEGTSRWIISMWCQDHPVAMMLGAMMLPVSTWICWHLADPEN